MFMVLLGSEVGKLPLSQRPWYCFCKGKGSEVPVIRVCVW